MTKDYKADRFKEILSISAKYGFKNGFGSPRELRLLFEELGPSFIKIGQVLSTRPDLLPKDYRDELKHLQDNVSLDSSINLETELKENIGDLIEDFEYLDTSPLASASLSEVYRGRLITKEEVIIKVQRPFVKEKMLADLAILKRLSPFINLGPTRELLDMSEVVDELESAIKKELNFLEERDNIKRFHKNNSSSKFITPVLVYDRYSTEKIIVMDYIDGIKIDGISELKEDGYDLDDLSKKLVYNYFQQIFDDGFFHADPHPGNILIHDKTISYIDFGLMGSLSQAMRKKLNMLLEAAVKKDTHNLSKAILEIGIMTGDLDFNSFHADINRIYNEYIDESIYNFDIGLILNEIVEICRKNNIAMPKDITLLAKGMLTIQGVVTNLSKNISIMEVALPFFKDRILRNKLENLDFFDLALRGYENLDNLYNMPLKLNKILDSLDDGNLELNVKLTIMDKSINKLDRMMNRLASALIIVGILISSSLVLSLAKLKIIGGLGYSLASLLGVLLLISIYKSSKE